MLTVAFGSRFYCAHGACIGFSWGDNNEPVTLVEYAGEVFASYEDSTAIGDCRILFDNNGTNDVRDDKIVAIF